MRTQVIELSGPVLISRNRERHAEPGRSLEMRTGLGSAQSRTPPGERLSNHLGQGLVTLA